MRPNFNSNNQLGLDLKLQSTENALDLISLVYFKTEDDDVDSVTEQQIHSTSNTRRSKPTGLSFYGR